MHHSRVAVCIRILHGVDMQVIDMFGTDMYVAAFIAVLVVMGLMKGAVRVQAAACTAHERRRIVSAFAKEMS